MKTKLSEFKVTSFQTKPAEQTETGAPTHGAWCLFCPLPSEYFDCTERKCM